MLHLVDMDNSVCVCVCVCVVCVHAHVHMCRNVHLWKYLVKDYIFIKMVGFLTEYEKIRRTL